MSAIKHALARLDQAVGKLEGSMSGYEDKLVGQQRDMFSAGSNPSNQNDVEPNGHVIDGNMVAQKLDSAIEKVEALLKEGAQG